MCGHVRSYMRNLHFTYHSADVTEGMIVQEAVDGAIQAA